MNAPEPVADWVEANQSVLVAEFERLVVRLSRGDEAAAADAAARARLGLPAPAAIDLLCEVFALTRFERELLLLLAGSEMDSRLAAACAAQRQAGQPCGPSFGWALSVLSDGHWSALTPARPLRRWRLVEVDTGSEPLTQARLRIDERVLHYLAGINSIDQRLQPWLRPVPLPVAVTPAQLALAATIAAQVQASSALRPLLEISGAEPDSREAVAAVAVDRLGLQLMSWDASAGFESAADSALLGTLWEREAALGGLALWVDCGRQPPSQALRQLLARIGSLVLAGTDHAIDWTRPVQHYSVPVPDLGQRRTAWQRALAQRWPADGSSGPPEPELDSVASHFQLGARRIAEIVGELPDAPRAGDLWRACRSASPARLADLAQSIETRAEWSDLVLPAEQLATLKQIVTQLRQRFTVHQRWGFGAFGGRGLGITALFAGDSGTGKTLAAEAVAQAAGLDLYGIDLASLVSKYIGETEKNLRSVFDAAEGCGAVLLFDEADALFGKRSEVKDSHDRYANLEVSYLLQRMEQYRGLAILATNHPTALDTAFMRRLRFVVNFPFPDAAQREALWRAAIPAGAPVQGLDIKRLARLNASGGTIRNVALGAAFLAAEDGSPITMGHLLRAARQDAAKRGGSLSSGETLGWQ